MMKAARKKWTTGKLISRCSAILVAGCILFVLIRLLWRPDYRHPAFDSACLNWRNLLFLLGILAIVSAGLWLIRLFLSGDLEYSVLAVLVLCAAYLPFLFLGKNLASGLQEAVWMSETAEFSNYGDWDTEIYDLPHFLILPEKTLVTEGTLHDTYDRGGDAIREESLELELVLDASAFDAEVLRLQQMEHLLRVCI